MIKKLIAERLGLRTEEDHQLAILDACRKLRQELEEKHKKEFADRASKAAKLFGQYSPKNHHFVGILPFLSRKDNFYWIVVEFRRQEFGAEGEYFPLCTMWVFDPRFPISLGTEKQGCMYFKIRGTKAEIQDLVVLRRREGIGSFLLGTLEQLARALGVKEISGKLLSQDAKERDVQVAFYAKNGYSVVLSEDGQTEGIRKVLE